MNYELAKRLREAGYPPKMKDGDPFYSHGELRFQGEYEDDGSAYRYNDHPKLKDIYCKAPTLSELIEACDRPDGVFYLYNQVTDDGSGLKTIWHATIRYGEKVIGSDQGDTPEVAVANLWLSLNNHSK